ncbi:MAG: nicotinate-nucleotide--dimethylbenzimidazole phosphoribosyltransferase [Clostridiales bacterium]|nr:nicotinate-nucleotide--dimethylbenzimidazole phosphoribosyltransferase [Clostridiales bacterium]
MESLYRQQLDVMLRGVRPADAASMERSRSHWDGIAKPIGGLGEMEELITKIAGIQRTPEVRIDKKALVIFCADNGVVAEGVTQTDSSVTAIVTDNFAKGITSVNRMAALADTDVFPVDIGVSGEIHEQGVWDCKVAPGTENFLKGPAMTAEQALEALHTGIRIAGQMKDMGYQLVAAGEMGIGNTTTSGAVAAAMLGLGAAAVAGRGAGLSAEGLVRKTEVIRKGLEMHHPDPEDPLAVLASVGGLDIAGICGLMLGGAIYGIPIVMDGMISASAALLARKFCPLVTDYLLPSHMGREPVCRHAMQALGLEPVIHARMALGEGTGAVMLFPLLEMAHAVYKENSTFEDIHIAAYERLE